jgi:uncharacterized OsmC-like protein
MKIIVTGAESLRLDPAPGPLAFEAPSPDQRYSPFHLLGGSLAACTHSVLQSWATHKGFSADDLRIDVSWTFAEKPHRVGAINVKLDWPSLAADMWPRAIRVANLCGVHNTLTHPPAITVAPAAP